nr:NTP transferase domain-containing protein [Alicyclobacillus fastidiosus]
MGRQKLLLPMPDGRPILRATIDAACGTSAAGVLLVIGEDGEKLAEAVAGAPVTVLRNPRASEGQSTSLHVAVAALIHLRASAGVFMLADQPEISPSRFRRSCKATRRAARRLCRRSTATALDIRYCSVPTSTMHC